MKPQENNNPYNIREINYSVNDSFKRPQISIQTKAETDKLEAKAESINIQNPQLRVELLNEKESENLKKKAMTKLLLSSERFGDDANFLLKNSDKVIFRSDDGHTVFVPEYKAKIYAAQNPTATQIPDTKKYVNDALETLSKQYTQEEYLKGKPEYAKRLDDLYKTFTPETKGKARAEAVNNLYEDIYGEEVGQAIENQITLIDESIAKYREKLEDDYVDDIKTGKTTALSRFLGSYKSSELRNLNLAEDLIGRIKDELRARKNQSGFWRSVIVDTNWSNILTADIESIYDAATERNLFKRLDQYGIDNLREDEKLLLDALVAGEAIKNYPKELTTLYKVGTTIVPSLFFMASYGASKFLLKGVKSGVKKIAEAALKKYIKQRTKELGVKTATEAAKKTFTQKAKDIAVRTGKELATSAAQAPLMPTYWANRIERHNGDIQITTDGFGENTTYMYDGREISNTPEYDAYMATLIDIASEKAGALIPFGKLNLGKYIGKAIPGDSKFWKNTRNFISGIGGEQLKRAVDFNGFVGEYSEELIAGTLNSMLVGDQKIEDVFAKQNMIETALSVGVISLGMGLVSGGLSIPASKKVKKEFLAAEEELKKVIPSPREREKFIREVATAGYEQQAAVMNKFVQAAENARKSGDMESSATYIEAANIIGRYMNAYNRYQTYNSYLDEQIKEKLETEKSAIQEATNPDMDNNIVVADYYGKNVKVVAGKVEFNEDGTVNTENSSESIVILNDDGSKQQVSPQGLTLKDMYESSELEAEAEARIRNEVQMQSDAATAEGKREYLTDEQAAYIRELGIHGIEVDDELDAYYTEDPQLSLVVAEARQRYPGTPNIGQQAQSASEQEQMQAQYPRDAKGNPDFTQITPEQATQILTTEYPEDYAEFVQNKVAAAEKRIEKASKAKPQSTDLSDIKTEREAIRAEQTAAQQEYDYWNNVKTLLNRQDVNTTEQITEEQPADANLSVAENETLQPGQTVEETTAAKQEEQQQYPTDEAGEPLWYEMTEKQFDVAMTELGDDADAFIADNIKEAQESIKKAEKAKPKSAEFAKRKAEQQAISAEKATAQRAYDFWTAQQARRIGASQKKAPQITQQVGENITDKYQTSNRTYGNTDTYILPSGEKINGRYVIVESDAITPSHDVNNGYQKSEGFPTDENGNTINDRDYHADKSAQTIVEQNAANYDARAIQTPVIVTNQGIVLSGNGRTMSGQIAASQGTDTEYLSYLKDHAGRYGFTAEQISGYQHPRLVLEVSENVPLNAETFAKFNAEDKKTISPTEKAVKAGKTVTDITLEKIAALLDDKETLSDVYADETATAQIIKILQSDGVININEVAELMDGKKLSAQGKDFLETLLVGKILNEQSVRLVAQMRNIRATVIKSIMPLLNNSRLRKGQNGENYSLSDELNKAIEFIYAADRANMPITDYISQTNLFDANPADIYDTATQIIAVALTKGQNNFKQFVNKYNTAAEHAASGQIDIFAGRIKTKKEILKEITGTYGNTGQAAADTQSRLGNSKVKSGIQSVRGDDAGNRGADTGGRGTEQGTERVTTTADTAQPAAAEQTTETPEENSNLSENEVRNETSPSGGDSNLSDTEERYRESEEPVSSETLAKDRAELEEIFGKSFFPNVFEVVKKRTAERMAEVSKAAKEFKAELKNAPEIILISDINDILKYDTQAKTIDDVYRRMTVKGWYSPGNGKIYVNLASHLTPEDVKATILHEAVGHSGLRRLLGKGAFDRLCNTVYQSLPEDKQKKMLEATRKTHPNATDEQLHLIVGDEYMATLAEGGAEQSIPQRIISAVRDFLRSIGIDLEINEADLRYLLHASYKNIKDADAVTVVNNSALLSRLRKAAEETHIKSEAESLFRLGKKSRDAYERLLAEKRPDMPENMRKEALDYLDSLEDTKANTKKIKIAVKWLADGTIRLPEDADKVDTAIEYANRKGIDAMQYNSPLDLIDALKGHVEIKDKPIDPDTVKELSNKVEYGDGLTVYEVENSEAGREAMRKIINTHFGKDASPWCLLQGDSEGNLTSQSAQYWQHYNAYPKRVAFKDGKLLAFFANDEDTPVWWDRLDRPNYDGIPVTGKIKGDPLGRSGTRIFNERTKTFGKLLDIHKGNKQNGTYEAWHYNGQMRVRAHYKNGIPVGSYESWYENGNPLVKISYNEKGEYDGLYEDWYENGQPHSRSNFKDDMVDGLSEDWYEDGQLKERCNYKDGNLDGLRELWYDDGHPLLRENYKNDKRNGIYKAWDTQGNLIQKSYYENGKLKESLPLDDSAEEVRFRVREDAPPQKTGIGYKVFVLKNGKLYPPMVANPNGADTPIGVWLDADAAPITGQSKTGRNQVKAGGKGTQGGSGKLAFRPGWHLGEIPYALQFNRIDETGVKSLFPRNFVWAEVEYANDVDYQDEARRYGINANGKYQHSLAGLPRIPVNGSYKYRTNPNPNTDPWIITGAIKINRLLTPSEVDEMVKNAGREPQQRQSGSITDDEVMQINKENMLSLDDDADIRFRANFDETIDDIKRLEYTKDGIRVWFYPKAGRRDYAYANKISKEDKEKLLSMSPEEAKAYALHLTHEAERIGRANREAIIKKKKQIADSIPITYDNFFTDTKGIFEETETPDREPDYISQKRFGWGESSRYWYGTDKGGDYVIRQSDHWSGYTKKGNPKMLDEDAVFNFATPIASCTWFLKETKGTVQDGKRTGKIYLSDLHKKYTNISLDTPEEQQVIIASEASERTYTETDKAPEIDYDMPATEVIEQISAKSSVEPLFRQGAFDKDFAAIVALQDAIKQTSLYQQNASSKELTNRLNVGLYDAMAPLKDFISQIEESRGQKIDDDHNPYYLENASASKAQERIESLKRDNIKPLAETTNDAAQLLQGREMLKLYLTGKTGLERQEVKEASQQNEGFYDYAGLTGLQRMLIIQQIGEANITDEVITTLNGLDYPQLLDYANEHNYQTIDKYVETCDKKLGDTGITLWEQIRDLSKKQLRGQYDAGLISSDAYYYLTTGIRISDVLAENKNKGIISDKTYNNIADADMDVSELRDKGYITQQQYDMLNTYKPLYMYYLPLKGDASITASDINDYESREQKNKSKISKVKGHGNLTRDPLTQLVSDCYGAIQNEEHNRWLREVLRAARLSNLSDNVVKITPLNVGATRVATEGETAAKQGKKRNERLIADVKATNKQVDEHSVIVFDGGRAYKMTFADLSLAKALRTSGGRFADASAFVNWASRKTRAWAMMLTTLNPMFVASNTFRDVGEALFVNYVNLGAKAIPVFVRAWNPANELQKAVHRHLKGKPGNTPYDALVKEYFDNGGPTSFSMLPDFDKIKSDMDKMVRDSKRGNHNPIKMTKTVLDWLEVQARHSELLSRVATYAMYRGTLPEYNIGKNASITEAIWQSKEVTVNFDKRGAWAKELGVTSLFWNAGRQSNRIHYNLLKNHPVRYLAATAAISSIKVALPGLLSTLVSYLYGDDEKGKEYLDKYYAINRYTRYNNLCLLWGDAIVKIPISPSFGPTAIMSEIVSEMIYTDFDKDRALSMTADLAQSMATLVGNDVFGSVVGTIAKGEPKELIGAIPFAIAQPFAELLANRNWQGRQIMRDYQGLDYLPAYYKAYGNVEDYYIESAKWINKITGGDEGKPGKLNKLIGNPAANKHIIESYLGGLGSFIFDSLNTGANIVNGRWDRVVAESPFKRFLGDPEVYQDQEAWEDYYSVKSKINELSTRINSYKQSGNERKAYKLEDVRDELKYLLKPYDDYIDASKEDMQEALNRNPKDAREIRRKHRRDMAKYLKTLKKQIEHIDTDL